MELFSALPRTEACRASLKRPFQVEMQIAYCRFSTKKTPSGFIAESNLQPFVKNFAAQIVKRTKAKGGPKKKILLLQIFFLLCLNIMTKMYY